MTTLAVTALAVSSVAALQVSTAAAAHASAADGTAGYFTPATGRVLDTRNGGGQFTAGTWRVISLATVVPSSGVSAVSVTFTSLNEAGSGFLSALPNGATQSVVSSQLNWNGTETISNTALVAVDASSRIQVRVSVNTDLLIDVQGYFATGNGTPAPGGYVANPNGGQRLIDTRNGTGVTAGRRAAGSTLTVNAGGKAGIPSTATAVFANITVLSYDPTDSFIKAYPTGGAAPTTSLNFQGNQTTALGSNIDLNGSGQFDINVSNTAAIQPVDILVDIQGYYDGTANSGAFTPANARLYDSRTLTARLAAGSLTKISIGGNSAVPAASTGIAAEALNVTGVTYGSGDTAAVKMWGTGQAEPATSAVNLTGAQVRSNLNTVVPGPTDNSIWVRTAGNASIDLVLDLEGWYATPNNLPVASGPNCAASGSQSSAQQTTHPLTDQASIAWNPVNGNLQLADSLLHMTGPGQGISVGLRYNSLNDARPTLSAGWSESALTVNPASGAVTYTAPDGACYVYTNPQTDPNDSTKTNYTKPANWNATLTRQGSDTYYLRSNPSGFTNVYNNNGTIWQLTSTSDQTNGNFIQYGYSANLLRTITMKDVASRSVSFAYNDPDNPTQPSAITETSLRRTRTVSMTYAAGGAMDSVTNAVGDKLTFGYTAGQITSITDNNTTDGGTGHTTTVGYDASKRVASWTLPTITGVSPAPAASTFTPFYDSLPNAAANPKTKGQTRLRDPNQNYATYELTDNGDGAGTTVTKITDMNGNTSSSQWSSHGDLQKRTNGLSNATAYAQGGNNLTNKITAPSATAGGGGAGGQTSSLTFPTSTSSDTMDQYRPGSSTDAQGNVSTMQYAAWNQPTTTTVTTSGNNTGIAVAHQTNTFQGQAGSGASTSTVDCGAYNGQQCTSDLTTSDGATTEHTAYGYDMSTGDLTSITRPIPLGAITMTYDGAGRMISRADGGTTAGGAANTAYFTYDDADRIVQVTYNTQTCTSGSASCVTYGYDHAGNMTSRVDSTGTTTYTFDAQNRITEKKTTKTSGGTTTTVADTAVGYDPAGNMLSSTDATTGSPLTTTYAYDPGNRVVSLAEPGTASCPALSGRPTTPTAGCTFFFYDTANNRTDTYLPNGRVNHVAYDTNNRITYQDNRDYSSTGGTTQANRSYAYTTGPMTGGQNTAGGLVSATGTGPQNNGQNVYNAYYSYDAQNRLTDLGTAANPTDSNATAYWHYDQFGNRTQNTAVGGATTYATYNLANQLCWTATTNGQCAAQPTAGSTGYTYDGAGNMTATAPTADTGQVASTFGYSAQEQMTTSNVAGAATTFGYADTSSDERTKINGLSLTNGILGLTYTATTNKQTEYIRDPAGTLIAMRTNDNNAGWVSHYYTTDRLGSTLILTGTTGAVEATYTYDTWGNLTSTAPTASSIAARNPYRYAAGYTDATGLIKFGTRYYNPTLGVWTQSDPAASGHNYYAYASDNPITNVDPSGKFSWNDFGNVLKGVGLVAGGIAAFAGGPVGLAFAGASLAADLGGDAAKGGSVKDYVGDAILDVGTFGLGKVAGSAAKAAGEGYEGFGKGVEHGIDGAATAASGAGYGRELYDDYS